MKNKVGVSYYPRGSSKRKWFWKSMDVSGVCVISEKELTFITKYLGCIRLKEYDFTIPLKDIVKIQLVTLNLIMPFGICITMADGREYMLGSLKRKKLKRLLELAINNLE